MFVDCLIYILGDPTFFLNKFSQKEHGLAVLIVIIVGLYKTLYFCIGFLFLSLSL